MTTHSMIQDVNGNINANSFLEGYATTATAAGNTTLTVSSAEQQFFTGTTTQTVKLPVTSTLVLGQKYIVVNNSTGVVTVQSSGANTIQAQAASTTAIYTCILTSGTTAASWSVTYINNNSGGSGTVNSGTAGQVGYYASTGTAISGGTLQNVLGVATNSSASTGYVGEYISSNITYGSPTTLNNGSATNITSISVTAGDWDVGGNAGIQFTGNASANNTAWVSTTSATPPDPSLYTQFGAAAFSSAVCPTIRVLTNSTITVYLGAVASFSSGAANGSGLIWARRRT